GAPEHEVVTIGVPRSPVEGRVRQFPRHRLKIGFDKALVVAPYGRQASGGQRRHDRHDTFLIDADLRTARFFEQTHVVTAYGKRRAAQLPRDVLDTPPTPPDPPPPP